MKGEQKPHYMESPKTKRRSMWERSDNPPPIVLQPRDDKILLAAFRHRFIQARHLRALLGGSEQNLERRCWLLWQHGFLDRPKAQQSVKVLLDRFAYSVTPKGLKKLLEDFPNRDFPNVDWKETPKKSRSFRFLEHELLVTTIMVGLRTACRDAGIPIIWDGYHHRKDYSIKVPGSRRKHYPDEKFVLVLNGKVHVHHFLEADRGNVSFKRMEERYKNYFRWWQFARPRSTKPPRYYRVLTVSEDEDYLHSLRNVARGIGSDQRNHKKTWRGLMFAPLKSIDLQDPSWILKQVVYFADEKNPVSLVPH